MRRQRYFLGGAVLGKILGGAATAVVGSLLGGGKGGSKEEQQQGQRQAAQKTFAQSFLESAISPAARQGRKAETESVTERGKNINSQIAHLALREIDEAYGPNREAAIKRIFGSNGAYQQSGIRSLPPSLQETLRS